MFVCFELLWSECTKQTSRNAVQIFMSLFDSVLGYSVAVGDFNEDGEDGKTFWYVSFFGITILLYFAELLLFFFFFIWALVSIRDFSKT